MSAVLSIVRGGCGHLQRGQALCRVLPAIGRPVSVLTAPLLHMWAPPPTSSVSQSASAIVKQTAPLSTATACRAAPSVAEDPLPSPPPATEIQPLHSPFQKPALQIGLSTAEDRNWTMPVAADRVSRAYHREGVHASMGNAMQGWCKMSTSRAANEDGNVIVTFRGSPEGMALRAEIVSQICHPSRVLGQAVRQEKIATPLMSVQRSLLSHDRAIVRMIEGLSGAELKTTGQRDGGFWKFSMVGTDDAIKSMSELIAHQVDLAEEEMTVPGHMIGRVIGPNGINVSMVGHKSDVKIKLQAATERSPGDPMLVKLTGSKPSIAVARELIATICEEDWDGTLPSDDSIHGMFLDEVRTEVVSESLSVPANAVGLIIGRDGQMIKKLIKLTGADFELRACTSAEGEGTMVEIKGSVAQVIRAKRVIRLMVAHSGSLDPAKFTSTKLRTQPPKSNAKVVITGGAGNMGSKAAAHLVTCGLDVHVLDPWVPTTPVDGVTYHQGNMLTTDWWPAVFDDAYAVIHLQAVNPYPGLSWAEAADSIELNVTVLSEAARRKVPRVIFASSNHVMGGYKEMGGAMVGPDAVPLTTDLPVACGTKWAAAGAWHDSVAYTSAKIAGERIASSLSLRHRDTQFISLRIGWCQPGENTPDQMTIVGGSLTEGTDGFTRADSVYPSDSHYDEDVILQWYKNMWLSNRDWQQIAERCVMGALPSDVPRHVILNANSKNTGSRWDVSETMRILGYEPQDDAARS